MKFITKTKSPKAPVEPKVKSKIPPITEQEQNNVDEWMKKHADHMRTLGCKTLAWFGLQWDTCPDYTHVRCGCGEHYIQATHHSKPVCTFEDTAKSQTKNSGNSE